MNNLQSTLSDKIDSFKIIESEEINISTPQAISVMKHLITNIDKMTVVPTYDGGIQLEWENVEIEVLPNGKVEILLELPDGKYLETFRDNINDNV